jgi:hypothetical protein
MMNLINSLMGIKQMKQGQERWEQGQELKEKQLASLEGSRQSAKDYYKQSLALREQALQKDDKLPATAALMEYMVSNGIAKDPAEAWDKINVTRTTQGLTPGQQETKYWRELGREYNTIDKLISRYDSAISSLENVGRMRPELANSV